MEIRLKELRSALNLNQAEFSEKIKLGQSTWAMIEVGKRNINDRHIKMICDEFNVNEAWLRTGYGKMFNDNSEEIIDKLALEYNLSQASKNIIASFLTMEKEERELLTKFVEKLYLNTNLDTTKNNSSNVNKSTENILHKKYDVPKKLITVFNQRASAGIGNYLLDNGSSDYETVQFNINEIPDNADFGVYITGDSMEPLLVNGQLIFIQQKLLLKNNQIGLFVLNGEAFCKKLFIDHKNKKIKLLSINPSYEPIEVTDLTNFRTIGKVLI